jgi:gliding motility-associated-like protein
LTANPYIVSPATTTTYTVVGTTLGCTGTATATVTVAGALVITVNSPTICVGGTAILTATGGTTYSWNQGATVGVSAANPYSVSPAVGTTVYTVTGTTNGCSGTATSTVTVNPIPFTTAGSNSPICAGVTLDLTATTSATPGVTYSWTGPNGFTSAVQNPSITAATTLASGAYTVTISAAGCSTTSVVNVTVNPGPITVAGANTPICEGVTLNLTATTSSVAGTTYNWVGPNSFTSALQNPVITAATNSATGSYTVTVAAAGCSSTSSVNVVVNPVPTTVAGSNSPICAGVTINLTATASATPGATYSWTGPNGFSSAVQNPSITAATTLASGSYTVTIAAAGCSSTSIVNVTVNPGPITVAGANTPICEGVTLNLTATASSVVGTTYNWVGPNSFTSAVQNPTISTATAAATGSYTVTVAAAGCSSTSSVNVVVNPVPTTVASSNSPICAGTSLNLAATVSAVAGSTYSWAGANSFSSALQNPSITGVTTAATGSYTVTVAANGCSSTSLVNVIVNAVPVTVASTTPICLGSDLNLLATASPGAAYSWTGPNGFSSTAQNPTIPAATIAATGAYIVTVTANSCSSTSTVNAVVSAAVLPLFPPGASVCQGTIAPVLMTTSLNGIIGSWLPNPVSTAITGPTTYNFMPNTGQCALPTSVVITINPIPVIVTSPRDTCSPYTVDLTNPSVTAGTTAGAILSYWQDPACTIALSGPSAVGFDGTYFIKADLAGCSAVASVAVVIHSSPLASFTPTPAIVSNLSPNSTMMNTSIGAVSYSWDFGDNQTSSANSPSHYFPDSDSGTYVITLTATNAFGCVDIAVSTVKVNEELLFYVPNTFTPDRDTYNESFQPIFTSGFDPFDYKLLIFDRWGEVIFESHNTDIGWRGLYGTDGVQVQDDTYTWKIEFTVKSTNQRKVVVGHVNVLR